MIPTTEVYIEIVYSHAHVYTRVLSTLTHVFYLVGQGDFKQLQSVLVPFLYHPAQVVVLLSGHASGHGAQWTGHTHLSY